MRLDVNGFNSNMIKSLPSFYLTEDRKQDNVLRRYLGSVFIGGTDDILKSINHTEDFIDPFKCPSEDLPALFKSWGLNYEPTLEEGYQRKLLANLGEVYRRKGSYSCVRYLVRSITGRDCDVIYTKTEDGERRLDVTLISDSLGDIVSGEIQRASEAIQKIIPQFLPFYLVPNVSFSSPRGSLDFPVRNKGFRTAERVFSDFTFKGLDNSFLNPNFDLGTEFWECSEDHTLVTSTVKKDSNKCLQSTWKTDSYFYQDFDVHYKDSYSVKAYFMCPTEYYNDPPVVTMLITCYRADGTIIHSILNSEVELNIKNRWDFLKRNIYIDEPLCTRVRLSFHCSVPNQVIYFSCPQLLLKSRVEQLQCADILSVTPEYNGCTVEWSPVMGANEYLIYSVTPKGELTLLNHWNTSNRYIWSNAPLAEEGLKLLVASSNGHITSELDSSKSALYYSRNSVTGNPVQIGDDSLNYPLQSLTLYGKSMQGYASYGGTPLGKNLLSLTTNTATYNGVTFTKNGDGSYTLNGTANGTAAFQFSITKSLPHLIGKDVIISGCPVGGSNKTYALQSYVEGFTEHKFDWGEGVRVENWEENRTILRITVASTYTVENLVFKPMIRLASEVDDTFEPYIGTPNPDCPADFVSVGDMGIEVTACGKNLFDIDTVTVGYVSSTGTIVNDKGYLLSEYIPCQNATHITVSGVVGSGTVWYRIAKYDSNKSFITRLAISGVQTGAYTFDVSDCSFFNFSYEDVPEIDSVVTNIQIEYGSTGTAYEPYKGNTATITSGLPLCSVGDVHDELVYNADGTGKIIKRTGITTFDGSTDERWGLSGSNKRINSNKLSGVAKPSTSSSVVMPCLCDRLTARSGAETYNGIEGIAFDASANVCIAFSVLADNSDISAWKDYLATNPVTVVYQLKTPQEIPLSKSEVLELQKYRGMTTVFNNEQAEMTVNYCSNKDFDLGGVALG